MHLYNIYCYITMYKCFLVTFRSTDKRYKSKESTRKKLVLRNYSQYFTMKREDLNMMEFKHLGRMQSSSKVRALSKGRGPLKNPHVLRNNATKSSTVATYPYI